MQLIREQNNDWLIFSVYFLVRLDKTYTFTEKY